MTSCHYSSNTYATLGCFAFLSVTSRNPHSELRILTTIPAIYHLSVLRHFQQGVLKSHLFLLCPLDPPFSGYTEMDDRGSQ